MNRLERALAIYRYINERDTYDVKTMYEDLGWEGYSYARFKRLFDGLDPYLVNGSTQAYNRELFILDYLKCHTNPERPYVVSARKLIYAMDLVERISVRSIERYIKDLKDAGIPILTKRGIEGGYKLGEKLK